MRRFRATACAFATLGTLAGCDGTNYTAINGTTHDCADAPNVSVAADGRRFELRGECNIVKVTGQGSTITIASVRTLTVNGSNLMVVAEAAGDITVGGNGNVVRYVRRVVGTPNNTSLVGSENSSIEPIK